MIILINWKNITKGKFLLNLSKNSYYFIDYFSFSYISEGTKSKDTFYTYQDKWQEMIKKHSDLLDYQYTVLNSQY